MPTLMIQCHSNTHSNSNSNSNTGKNVAAAGAIGAGTAAIGKQRGHRHNDSGVSGLSGDRKSRSRSSSLSSSDMEYRADGSKVKKTSKLGSLFQKKSHPQAV